MAGVAGRGAAAAAAGVLLLAGPALGVGASDDRRATPEEQARVEAELSRQGYTNVHDVELDDGRFEADATSPDGHEVDVELDLDTVEVLEVDAD